MKEAKPPTEQKERKAAIITGDVFGKVPDRSALEFHNQVRELSKSIADFSGRLSVVEAGACASNEQSKSEEALENLECKLNSIEDSLYAVKKEGEDPSICDRLFVLENSTTETDLKDRLDRINSYVKTFIKAQKALEDSLGTIKSLKNKVEDSLITVKNVENKVKDSLITVKSLDNKVKDNLIAVKSLDNSVKDNKTLIQNVRLEANDNIDLLKTRITRLEEKINLIEQLDSRQRPPNRFNKWFWVCVACFGMALLIIGFNIPAGLPQAVVLALGLFLPFVGLSKI